MDMKQKRPIETPLFTRELLRWFATNRRDLPWRETTDPYAIWLSEIILQQTRIQQGMDYWRRFVQRWPNVEALAAATEDEVLREWQGLGYYSRARNLLQAARQVVEWGGFPHTMSGLLKMKGVGEYTAAAIGSFAFGLQEAVVDGNVYRVLARYFGIETPIDTTEGKKVFKAMAQSLLPCEAAAFNQAIMDFGATQCTHPTPKCTVCPLQETCVAWLDDKTGRLPVKSKRMKVLERTLNYVYLRCKGMTAIHRRGEGDIWQGLWEPLRVDSIEQVHFQGKLAVVAENVRHVLTHRLLRVNFYMLETDVRPELPDDYIWIDERELKKFAVPRIIEILNEKTDKPDMSDRNAAPCGSPPF